MLIALLLAGLAACADPAPQPGGQAAVAPEPLGPRGPTQIPFAFTWKPVPGQSPIYRVQVTDAAERVLFEQDLRKTKCVPSAEFKAMMADRATFRWTVSVLSADGTQAVASSAPLEFSLK